MELNVLRPLKDNKPLPEKHLLEKEIQLDAREEAVASREQAALRTHLSISQQTAALAAEKSKMDEMKRAILQAAGLSSDSPNMGTNQSGTNGPPVVPPTYVAPVQQDRVVTNTDADDALQSARNWCAMGARWFQDAPSVFEPINDALSNIKSFAEEREKDARRAEHQRDEQRAQLEEERVGREERLAKDRIVSEERAREERLHLEEQIQRVEQERDEHQQVLEAERWELEKIMTKEKVESEERARVVRLDFEDRLRRERVMREEAEDKIRQLERNQSDTERMKRKIKESIKSMNELDQTLSGSAPAAESAQPSWDSTNSSSSSPTPPPYISRKRKSEFDNEGSSECRRSRCSGCKQLRDNVGWHFKCCTTCREERGLEPAFQRRFGNQPCAYCKVRTLNEALVCFESCRRGLAIR